VANTEVTGDHGTSSRENDDEILQDSIASLGLNPHFELFRRPEQISARREVGEGKVSKESVGRVAVSGFGIFRRT
jgi:hypothetical protein